MACIPVQIYSMPGHLLLKVYCRIIFCKLHLIEANTARCYDGGLDREQCISCPYTCGEMQRSVQALRSRLSMGPLQNCKLCST